MPEKPTPIVDFRKSVEFAWRRLLRSAVRESKMTRAQKDVVISLLNLWLHHKNGPKGYIHPGRLKIAESAKVTEKTVSRTLAILRAADVLRVRRRLHGEGKSPTEYTMDLEALLFFCGAKLPKWVEGKLIELQNKSAQMRTEVERYDSGVRAEVECYDSVFGWTECPTAITTASIVFTSVSNATANGGHDE